MSDTDVDISYVKLDILDRPVGTASLELIRSYGLMPGELEIDELVDHLVETFVLGEDWCTVGEDLHQVSSGSAEVRLRARDGSSWHADLFHANWGKFSDYENVPSDYRPVVATYVDRMRLLEFGVPQEADLRAAAAEGGAVAVDRIIQHCIRMLDRQIAAVDALHTGLHTPEGILPGWARRVVRQQAADWLFRREYVTSAVLGYHHGSTGSRPDTIDGGISFPFALGAFDILDGSAALDPDS